MKKINKSRILEIIILLTIIASIIVIIFLAQNLLKEKPEISSSNQTINYSKNKIIEYSKNSYESLTYNIPLNEYINFEKSTYIVYLSSTDNIINTLTEIINIYYNDIPNDNKNIIINYCNAYDNIESKYKLKCKLNGKNLFIKNTFYINQLNKDTIKNNNLEIKLPVTYDSKLNEYLNYLTSQSIEYQEVNEIKD